MGGIRTRPWRCWAAATTAGDQEAETLQYLGQQRTAREHGLSRLITAEQRAVQATQAKIADLRRLITSLSGQRHKVAALIAKFQPESPVTGPASPRG